MSETMLKRFDWAPWCGVLALLFMLLPPADLSAQPHRPPGQSGTQEKDAPQQAAATPSDSVTIPDGTPLILQLVSELSSATAKVGDTVQFITLPLRIDGLVVAPKGTALSGTVVLVVHTHRPSKNGRVFVAFDKVVFPSGEIGVLRPSKGATGNPGGMAAQPKPGDAVGQWGAGQWAVASVVAPFTVALVGPVVLFTKGHEAFYPAGTRTTVYFNGPLKLDRGALLKLQPPPYKGPAQVFFNDTSGHMNNCDCNFFNDNFGHSYSCDCNFDALFCGEVRVGPLSAPVRLELNPGTYSFTARLDLSGHDVHHKANKKREERYAKWDLESKLKAKPVQLEVHEDHQYWIERDGRGLLVKDPEAHPAEFDIVQGELRTVDRDFTSLPPQDSCPQTARPAAQPF
jgi:hypothetical protein